MMEIIFQKKAKKEIIEMAVPLLNKKQPLLILNFGNYEITVLSDSKIYWLNLKERLAIVFM
ncbi:hypothetical protein [Flavobacterium sp.]|uniref:hypothetical protein n=1 Tax=Flavobacterium sp. TaxID=239 RepID=UPI003265795C